MAVPVESAKVRKERANEWKRFRQDYLFTQRRLAGIVGISRRTIQQIEGAKITPHNDTLRLFAAFKKRHEENAEDTDYEVNWSEELSKEMKESSNG